MSNEKKTYVCRRMRVLSHLLQNGFEPFAVSTDFNNPKYKVWLFTETKELRVCWRILRRSAKIIIKSREKEN